MRFGAIIGIIGIGGAIVAGALWANGVWATQAQTVTARRGTAAEVVYATGVVEPVRWAKVIALARKRIVELCTECEGKPVKRGDKLAQLDDDEERALLSEYEARRQRIAGDIERISGLVARNAAPQTQLDQSITQLREYEARITAQKERIADLVLRAPMDGVVLRSDGEVGEIAGTGAADVLFWVGPPKPLRIVADVSEEDIPRVRPGLKALLRSEGFRDRTLDAQVADITPKGDPVTKTFRVYLALPDETPLRIGMSVEANVVTREKPDALLLPAEAVLDGAIFVVEDERLRRRAVQIGLRGVRMLEIVSGVDEGAQVASPARANWRDGMRVRATAQATP